MNNNILIHIYEYMYIYNCIYTSLPVWSSHLCQGNVHNITAIVLLYSGIPHGHAEESGIDTAKFPAPWKRFVVNGIILYQAQRMVFGSYMILPTQTKGTHNIK